MDTKLRSRLAQGVIFGWLAFHHKTYFYAVALLVSIVIQYLRRRAKRKSLGHHPA